MPSALAASAATNGLGRLYIMLLTYGPPNRYRRDCFLHDRPDNIQNVSELGKNVNVRRSS